MQVRSDVLVKGERLESVAIRFEKLVLELHPLQSQRVQKALHQVHAHQDAEGQVDENGPAEENHKERARFHAASDRLREEDFRKLSVGKTECPQTQVTGGIGDASKHEFDGFDDLVDHDFPEFELFLVFLDQCVFLLFIVVLIQQNQGFREQHQRDHDQGCNQEIELQGFL